MDGMYLSLGRILVNHIRCIIPLVVCWFLWKGRNKSRFEGIKFLAQQVIFEVERFLHELGQAR